MKLKLALATAFLAVSASSAQADTRTPEILSSLSSLSSHSIQEMNTTESSQARGQYYEIKVSYNPTTEKKTISKGLKIKWRSNYPSNSSHIGSDGTIYTTKIKRIFHVWRLHVSR